MVIVYRAEKAAVKTDNAGAEAAMEWLFAHMDDADIDSPLEQKGQSRNNAGKVQIAVLRHCLSSNSYASCWCLNNS